MLAETRHEPADTPAEVVRAAFRELHGRRLHGFALLLTLGDGPRAAQLAADALNAGLARVDELRHPERAAAWLRARVVASSLGLRPTNGRPNDRFHTLAELGADRAVVSALAALAHLERAALIVSSLERLDRRDVATVVGRNGSGLDRLLTRARRRYAAAYATATPENRASAGPLTARLSAIAERAMG
jgi:DNA-directed RNA polymerase specialized sigma24 family protein